MNGKPNIIAEWHDQITDTYYLKCNDVTIKLDGDHPYREAEKSALIRAARIALIWIERDGAELTAEGWLTATGKEMENEKRELERWREIKRAAREKQNER